MARISAQRLGGSNFGLGTESLAWTDHGSMARITTQWLRGSDLETVLARISAQSGSGRARQVEQTRVGIAGQILWHGRSARGSGAPEVDRRVEARSTSDRLVFHGIWSLVVPAALEARERFSETVGGAWRRVRMRSMIGKTGFF
uniref:Uncharacterized protein n=1 Tax=Fagus sylvatica TaxID=28930 RepID=A0A2N9HM65_FAGSY